MESLDVSGQTLLYAGFRGAAARAL